MLALLQEMKVSDWIMVCAVLAGPIIAIQVTRFLDNKKELRARKLDVFKSLMATRAYNISMEHVSALNRIDLEFDKKNPKEKAVIEAWKIYLDHLNRPGSSIDQWATKRLDLFVDLLHTMALVLNYDFDKVHIKNASYAPQAHGDADSEITRLRQLTLEVLDGKRTLPMHVTNIQNNQE